jgi:sn-glycerol 3-phosphate transport system ATP-binding protein
MNLVPLASDALREQFASATPGSAGILGVRPEDFAISSGDIPGGIALDLTVETIEHVGAETFVYGSRQKDGTGIAANPGELAAGEVIVRVPGTAAPAIGHRFRAVAPRDKLHLFSADGRQRIAL